MIYWAKQAQKLGANIEIFRLLMFPKRGHIRETIIFLRETISRFFSSSKESSHVMSFWVHVFRGSLHGHQKAARLPSQY